MSLKLLGQVQDLLLPRCLKEVLGALCNSADDIPGQPGVGINCYPSVPVVAWRTDYSERQVQRALRDLESNPHIIAAVRTHPAYGTTEYEIHLERAPKKPPFQPNVRRQGGGRNGLQRGDMVSPLGVASQAPRGETSCHPEGRPVRHSEGRSTSHRGVTPRHPEGRKNTHQGGDTMSPDPLSTYPGEREPHCSIPSEETNNEFSEQAGYVDRVLKTFVQIPGAALTVDRSIPQRWFAEKVPIKTVENALWIGAVRHVFGPNFHRTVNLAYFEPVVRELSTDDTPVHSLRLGYIARPGYEDRFVEFIKFRMPDYLRLRAEGFGEELVQ